MKRHDFLGPKTITVAAGIPPMGTIFTAVPPVNYRPAIDPQPSFPGAPSLVPGAQSEIFKIHLTPMAPHRGCSA